MSTLQGQNRETELDPPQPVSQQVLHQGSAEQGRTGQGWLLAARSRCTPTPWLTASLRSDGPLSDTREHPAPPRRPLQGGGGGSSSKRNRRDRGGGAKNKQATTSSTTPAALSVVSALEAHSGPAVIVERVDPAAVVIMDSTGIVAGATASQPHLEDVCGDLGDSLKNDLSWILSESDLDLEQQLDRYRSSEDAAAAAALQLEEDLFGSGSGVADGVVSVNGSVPSASSPDWWTCFGPGSGPGGAADGGITTFELLYGGAETDDACVVDHHVTIPGELVFGDPSTSVTVAQQQQPWADCKAALEAAALELETYAEMDVVPGY
ncbi:hypothetical protein MTO96_011540 [Rhipicephalus appendiculatus]